MKLIFNFLLLVCVANAQLVDFMDIIQNNMCGYCFLDDGILIENAIPNVSLQIVSDFYRCDQEMALREEAKILNTPILPHIMSISYYNSTEISFYFNRKVTGKLSICPVMGVKHAIFSNNCFPYNEFVFENTKVFTIVFEEGALDYQTQLKTSLFSIFITHVSNMRN